MNAIRHIPGRAPAGYLLLVPVAIAAVLVTAGCNQPSDPPTSAVVASTSNVPAGTPKLIDLGATQCIPCKMMAPILDEMKADYAGVLDVEFIDVTLAENKETAKSYGIDEIPTQVFLDAAGKELWRHVGFIPKAAILAKWEELGYALAPASASNDPDQAPAADAVHPTPDPDAAGTASNDGSAAPGAASGVADGPTTTTVYYLFNTFRCATCRKVEALTREAVLGTPEAPGPFADEIAAGKLSFEGLNVEEEENEHLLNDFGAQMKIPVIAELAGSSIVRFVALDQAWFLLDDKPRFLAYVRDALKEFAEGAASGQETSAGTPEYLSARAAFEKAKSDPQAFHILDIRTPEEYIFIGHPENARNIPVMFMGYSFDEKMGRQTMIVNAAFAEETRQHFSPEDHLAILGDSIPRAALAVRLLKKAGFQHLHAIANGFRGEKQGQKGSPDFGRRTVAGWINEGVPWTTALDPAFMYQRSSQVDR